MPLELELKQALVSQGRAIVSTNGIKAMSL